MTAAHALVIAVPSSTVATVGTRVSIPMLPALATAAMDQARGAFLHILRTEIVTHKTTTTSAVSRVQ